MITYTITEQRRGRRAGTYMVRFHGPASAIGAVGPFYSRRDAHAEASRLGAAMRDALDAHGLPAPSTALLAAFYADHIA